MNDTPQADWFYSHEGEKLGPLTFSELKAKESELNPRLDMVWTQGMAEWQPAGEIEGLFERRSLSEPEEAPVPADMDDTTPFNAEEAGERVWPGAGRLTFIAATLGFPLLLRFGVDSASGVLTKELSAELLKATMLAAQILPILVSIIFTLERLRNVAMSRWWIFGNLIPLLNLWVGYRCFVCPAGYAEHKKLDGLGILLAVLYWLMTLTVILAIGAAIALWHGVIGLPEHQEQLREIIRAAIPSIPKS